MTREEIDVLWQQAISESMKETQYEFANLILESAAKEFDLIPYGKVDRQTAIFAIRSLKV